MTSSVKTVLLNIVGIAVGAIVLWYALPLLLTFFAWLVSIPVLGEIICFGVKPEFIVFPYSVGILGVIVAIIANVICRQNVNGRNWGSVILGAMALIQLGYTTYSLFSLNGFALVFVIFALESIGLSLFLIIGGLSSD